MSRLTKLVPCDNQEDITQILHTAEELLQGIPAGDATLTWQKPPHPRAYQGWPCSGQSQR